MENCLIKSRAELLYLLLHQSSSSLAQLLMQTSCASRFTPNTKDRELSQILLRTHNPVWQITILTWEQCRSNKHPALLSSSNIYIWFDCSLLSVILLVFQTCLADAAHIHEKHTAGFLRRPILARCSTVDVVTWSRPRVYPAGRGGLTMQGLIAI